MITFTVISHQSDLVDTIRQSLVKALGEELEFNRVSEQPSIENHLFYEVPQFVLFDLDDPTIASVSLIKQIVADPLLLNVRILGLAEETEENTPIIPGVFSILSSSQVTTLLPHLVHILSSNQQLILQTGLIRELGHQGTLSIANDPLLLEGYAELIANFLYRDNLIDIQTKYGLKFALVEMLMNGVEHGNCGIVYEEKTKWLEEGNDIVELIRDKCKDPRIQAKHVTLTYEIGDQASSFVIQDEGEGFDVSALPDPEDVLAIMDLHGRGIFMSRNFVKELRYNEKGNQVTLAIAHMANPDRSIPQGFQNSHVIEFEPGDIVFREQDKSNSLYYIIGGDFEVLAQDRVITTLNNTNIFLGEMAFLLGNRRTATVRAKTKGHLVAINAKEWMDAVQKYPYYGLFLSRLLAKKLDEQTHY